jgi:photosystem II stability/assembly factor-like uncharacterized protein
VDEGLGDAFISGFVIDERNPGTLYVAVSDRDEGGVFKSTDGAETWMRILGEPGAERDVRQIALDPSDSQSIFASTIAGLRKTINGGESWEPVGNG